MAVIHSKLGAINLLQACPSNPTACESGIYPQKLGRSRSTQVSKNTSLFLLRALDFSLLDLDISNETKTGCFCLYRGLCSTQLYITLLSNQPA